MKTAQLITFAKELDLKMTESSRNEGKGIGVYKIPKIFRIESPEYGGDITVVFEHSSWKNKKAITYRADGTWSGMSYWTEDQI